MVRKQVSRHLWDYGMSWITETMSFTFLSAGETNGGISLLNVIGETVDTSKYLDFGFYDCAWFKDNVGIGPAELVCQLGISRQAG
mmetsp:Transcript_9628/g.21382  ORF Transcript_9628/g.21382 Transcript_9628/m.21382 type:complete len:85 (-) Transcript_9628:798-1052(-)